MKISDIVTLNIESSVTYNPNLTEMNSVGAIVFINISSTSTAAGPTDGTWISSNALGLSYVGKTEIDRAINTFVTNGGVSLVAKRLYFTNSVTSAQIIDEITKAVYGGSGITSIVHTALGDEIKNIQLVWTKNSDGNEPQIGFSGLASNLLKTDSPEQTKILFITSTSAPVGLTLTPNIFYHFIGSSATVNYFESIAAMAYLSKINYTLDTIKDYEYTIWGNGDSEVNLLNSLPTGTESGGIVNFFSKTAGLNILIGGYMTNGVRLISYYFGLILSHRISELLTRLTIEKLNFNQTSYAYIYNIITIEMDKFASNGLLDTSYVATETKLVFRDNIRYKLIEEGKILDYGYVVNTLPPTQNDLATRNYTGVYILYAIANQIRTLEIRGIVLGGLS